MADIELDNLGEDRTEREQTEREEDTSFTEGTDNADAEYDNIRTQINLESTDQTRVDLNDFDFTDVTRLLAKNQQDKEVRKEGAIQILRITNENLGDYGVSSRELFDGISEAKFSNKGKLTALKFKREDVKLTAKGKINRSATVQNREILKAIENAKVEYNASINAVIDESVGSSMSDVAAESVQESVVGSLEDLVWDKYNEISQSDPDKNIEREIRGIPYVDENIDYDDLGNSNQRTQYDAKIAGLKVDIEHWKDLEQHEQDPTKKLLYETSKELCIAKKSYMEVKAGFRPESEEALSMIQEEARTNDLTRFKRFKKWAKENIAGVSAVAISIAGIITTIVIAGRNAVKKGAKAVGQFGKALANVAKKAVPAIATILNILAQALTWGAKVLEFLSRNLWIVALGMLVSFMILKKPNLFLQATIYCWRNTNFQKNVCQ